MATSSVTLLVLVLIAVVVLILIVIVVLVLVVIVILVLVVRHCVSLLKIFFLGISIPFSLVQPYFVSFLKKYTKVCYFYQRSHKLLLEVFL